MKYLLALLILAAGCASQGRDFVRISADGKGFNNITPWGFNYDRDHRLRLLEEYWESEWATVEADFREMKALGANVVRVHLQFHAFMDSPDRPNRANLARLKKLMQLAEALNLKLDITGLASYRKQKVPRWYDDMDEPSRWKAHANFWAAIAKACAESPAIFCYDLMNEPVVPEKKADTWLVPVELAGFSYVQHITKDPAGRDRMQIARDWTAQMVAAIRKHDRHHLITLGLMPWSSDLANALVGQLDFISVHIYPESVESSLVLLNKFALGKPLVIEEIFPLKLARPQFREFLMRARPPATGVIGFYWGQTPGELKASPSITDQQMLQWLEVFQELHPVQTP